MFGVYGMLAVALMLFCLRYIVRPDRWSTRAEGVSFVLLNVGLAWMALVNLLPVGTIQIYDAVQNGYGHARGLDFVLQPVVHALEWARLPGDIILTMGVLPLVYLAFQAVIHPKPVVERPEPMETSLFTEVIEQP